MSNISIFNQDIPDFLKGGVNELTKSLAGGASGGRRISIRGGVFRKIVNGEEIAKIKGRELNVIIVNANKNVSRIFYAGKYNPDEIVPPTCWSSEGITPDAKVEDKQGTSCASCPQNIAGSGNGTSRACRYQRRIAVVLEGDMSGDVYQLMLPSTSIFGKGEGNVHPFESYVKYIANNGRNINQIVTQIELDMDSDTPKLLFSPVRHIDAEEWAVVERAGGSQEAKNAIMMTVAQTDGVKKELLPPPVAKPKVVVQEEPDEVIPEPVKRTSKKTEVAPANKQDLAAVISAWGDLE
jgi:hypothetical protein